MLQEVQVVFDDGGSLREMPFRNLLGGCRNHLLMEVRVLFWQVEMLIRQKEK